MDSLPLASFAHAPGNDNCSAALREGNIQTGAVVPRRSSIRRVAFASFIGTAIEWYDFYLYGTTAALVFPRLFFPQLSTFAATLASFATFGVAFVARPFGGILFGHFGDRVGRKSMLVITLVLMGLSTFFIGVVPTYVEIGVLAPLLLVLLRFLQGLAVGGEWGGATLMVVEHAPEHARNFYAAWPQLGSPAGLMLSTAVFAAFSSLPDQQFFVWGWRVPFLLSIFLVAVGLFIRLRIVESPVFASIKSLKLESRVPLMELLRGHSVAALLAIGISIAIFVEFYIVSTFVPAYATAQLGVSRGVALAGVLSMGAGLFAGVSLAAAFADQYGKRRVGFAGALGMCLPAFPAFWLIDTGSPVLICLAMGIWMIGAGVLYGVSGALTAELFPARLRYSGISFGAQVAGLLGAALTPVIAATLVNWFGGKSWPVAAYVATAALLPLSAIWFASDKYRVSITDTHGAGVTPSPQPQPA